VFEFILSFIAAVRVFFRSRSDTALEVLALRQQVAVLKRKRPRPVFSSLDRLFWTTLRRRWSRWVDVLLIVKPETVIGWHRTGFRLPWLGVGVPATLVHPRYSRAPGRSRYSTKVFRKRSRDGDLSP
jgi:hypothetical protein